MGKMEKDLTDQVEKEFAKPKEQKMDAKSKFRNTGENDGKPKVDKALLDQILKRLEDQEKKLQEKEEVIQKLQEQGNQIDKKIKGFDLTDLDSLVSKANKEKEFNPEKMVIRTAEEIVEGELVEYTVCDFTVPSRRNPITQLLTLDLLITKVNYRKEFATYFNGKVKELGTDLDYSEEVNAMLISRGIINTSILKNQSKGFLAKLITTVYGENGYKKVLSEISEKKSK